MKHLYQNSEVIYCAESLDQCWELFERDTGMTREEEGTSDPFEQIPDDKELDVGAEDPGHDPTEEARPMKNRKGQVVATWYFTKKLAWEWAAGFEPGHFSGGDY